MHHLIFKKALEQAYVRNAKWRLKNRGKAQHFVPVKVTKLCLDRVIEQLQDVRLAPLFVEAQFNTMPTDWCIKKFKRPYPPPSTVFGGDCLGRYKRYLEEGIHQ